MRALQVLLCLSWARLRDEGPHDLSSFLQVLAEARRLGFHSVRGNHDDKALAAFELLQVWTRLADEPHLVL